MSVKRTLSRRCCSHYQCGRHTYHHSLGLLDSWIFGILGTHTLNIPVHDATPASASPKFTDRTVLTEPSKYSFRRKHRKRRCRRWQERSLLYRRRHNATRRKRRRTLIEFSGSDVSTSSYLRHRKLLTGGGPRDDSPRYTPPTMFQLETGEDSLPLDDDEDWYPLYVLQASRMTTQHPSRPHLLDVHSRADFQDQSISWWTQQLSAMGVPFGNRTEAITNLLPETTNVSRGYPIRSVPEIDVSSLSLEEVLTHIRVVYKRLARLQKFRSKVKRKLGQLYGRKSKMSYNLKREMTDKLTSELYNVRSTIRAYDDLHKRLCRKSKARVREVSNRLPKTIHVPLSMPSIPVRNRFAVLDEDHLQIRCEWRDFLSVPSTVSMGQVTQPPGAPTSFLQSSVSNTPLDTFMNIRKDLGTLQPFLPGQVPDMAYGMLGGYKTIEAASQRSLVIMTLNVNGLTHHKLPLLCRTMMQDMVDVLICVDTRHSPDIIRTFKKKVKDQLGPGTTCYFSRDPERKHNEPGGIGFIAGPKWGSSVDHDGSITDRSGQGVLAKIRLRTTSGFLSLYGTYWPFAPASLNTDNGYAKLWVRVRQYCIHEKMHDSDPIKFIQSLTDQWMSRDWEAGCEGVILGGDFNSTWLPGESGGQRSLYSWADLRFLINGPRLIQERCNIPFYTYGKLNGQGGTWIDHILHAGSHDTLDIIGAFNDQGPFTEQLSDHHRALIAVYSTRPPAGPRVITMPKVPPRPEISRGDKHEIAVFRQELRRALHQINTVANTALEAEIALEHATAFTVQLVRSINAAHGRRSGNRKKDGYSPEYILRKLHLCGMIEIRRRLTGQGGKSRWQDYTTARAGMDYIFRIMHKRGEDMGLSEPKVRRILNVDKASPEYIMSLPSSPSPQACDEAIRRLRLKVQGRARSDMRLAHRGYMSYIEANREKGRLKTVVKAIMGSHAGRRHQDGLQMDSVNMADGTVIGDPEHVHSIWTQHFREFYKLPQQFDNELHRTEDWGPIMDDRDHFMSIHQNSNIPQWCLDIIFTSLQKKPQAEQVHTTLCRTLAEPPTLDAFYKSIRCSKTNSAPGPSGLSYNMLKSMPREMVEQIHQWLVLLWTERKSIASWGWRWLHLISKTIKDNLGVNDCRPIMLCEALRKVWGSAILMHITAALHESHVLEDIQHGFIAGRGTDTASILHINHMEDVEEYTGISHDSTFDLQAAFDSVSIPCQFWSLRRVGIPYHTAHDLATADVGGTTIVRSPFAEFLWHQLPYQCVQTQGTVPPSWFVATPDSALVESFCPERGTGQGVENSPTKWNIFFDIIATGLRILDLHEASPTYVGSENNDVYEHRDIFYADDHKASTSSAIMLQKKAELVSAFCIVLGLKLSEKKIRRVVQSFVSPRLGGEVMNMTVYTAGWVPHQVNVQTSGTTEFLGGIYDTDNTGHGALEWLKTKAGVASQCIRSRKSFSAAAKISVLNMSIISSMVYKASNSILTHDELESIDQIIDNVLLSTTKNMFSFPRKLLHISTEHGGHGILSFSFEAESRKLQRIFACLRSSQSHGLAARGILCRAGRQHGYFASSGQQIIIVPGKVGRTNQRTYCDGPITMMARHGIYICRHGQSISLSDPSFPLVNLHGDNDTLRQYCFKHGFLTIGDLCHIKDGITSWYLPDDLSSLVQVLSAVPLFTSPTLLVGQYWQPFSHARFSSILLSDILRIDGQLQQNILVTRFAKIRGSTYYRQVQGQLSIPYNIIFSRPLTSRCSLQRHNDGRYSRHHVRIQHSPVWMTYTGSSTPEWISWVLNKVREQGDSYAARPYTDGSYTKSATIQNYFRPNVSAGKATAAIIVKDTSAEWKSKPVIAVYIDRGEDIGAEEAFTMEFLALAASLQATVLADGTLHATGSDAKAVLDLIPKRRGRLQHVMRDHHFLLQCLDNSLFRGAPVPFKVPSHVEREKKQKDANGRLGLGWTQDEWGNWIADRIAAYDLAELRKQGIAYHVIRVTARQVYSTLMYNGQWYLGDKMGAPILPAGAKKIIQQEIHRKYLQERDEYRKRRGDAPIWELDSSMTHASTVYEVHRASPNTISARVRTIYDKGYHGGNRAKDESLTPEQRTAARKCKLCGMPDSNNHWLNECSYGALSKIRLEIMADLNRILLSYREKSTLHRQLGAAFKQILTTTSIPARIWTGNWSTNQIKEFENMINPELLPLFTPNTLSTIILPLERILAEGALNMWQYKVVEERKRPRQESIPIKLSGSAPTRHSKGQKEQGKSRKNNSQGYTISRAKRLEISQPILPSTRSSLTTTIAFPALSLIYQKEIKGLCMPNKNSKSIRQIHDITIYGSFIHSLCGNEDGSRYNGGHLHNSILKAFILILIQSSGAAVQLLTDKDRHSFLDGHWSMSSIPKKNTHDKPVVQPSWIIILLPDNTCGHNTHGNAICIDIFNTCTHYFCLENTHTDTITLHNSRLDHLLNNYSLSGDTKWSRQIHRGAGVDIEDGAIWLGLGIQMILSRLDIPQWVQDYSTLGRHYFASCILDGKCPPAVSLIVLSANSESTDYDRIGDHQGTIDENDANSERSDLASCLLNGECPAADSPLILSADSESLKHVTIRGQLPNTDGAVTDPVLSYNMLHPDYTYSPIYDRSFLSVSLGKPDILKRSLTTSDCICLTNWLRGKELTSTIYNDMLKGEVTAGDILSLIQPTTLTIGLLLFLLHSLYPVNHSSVVILDQGVMEVIQARCWLTVFQDPESPAFHSLHDFISVYGSKEWIVVLYCDNTHFTGHVVRCNYTRMNTDETMRGRIWYLDSFKNTGTEQTKCLQDFLSWTGQVSAKPILRSEWLIVQNPTGSMQQQIMYRDPGQDVDKGSHIDCGLYAFFMIVQTLAGGAVDGFTPENIHFTRPILAFLLAQNLRIPDITYWIGTVPQSIMMTTLTQDIIPQVNTRVTLPRAVKRKQLTHCDVPIPPGRKVHSIDLQTYVADSTLNDAAQGIDAGRGLFASRKFDPDTPYEDNDLVAFYSGTILTPTELDHILSNPRKDRMTGFILSFQGLIIDGWDHANNRYAGVASVINDFLDDRNNCQPSKELIPNITKLKAGTYRIAIRVTRPVSQHSEFGFAYGESAFCNADLPTPVLFKAARYYYKEIKKHGLDRWSKLPQARYLFNTPYHGAAPGTSDESVSRMIRHLRCCNTNSCTCDLELFLGTRNTNKVETGYVRTAERDNYLLQDNQLSAFTTSILKTRNKQVEGVSTTHKQHEVIATVLDQDQDPIIPPAYLTVNKPLSTAAQTGTIIVQDSFLPSNNGLCFDDAIVSWTDLDYRCEFDDNFSHHTKGPRKFRSTLYTTELQDLRAHRLGTTTLGAYFKVLCSRYRHVQYVDPIYTNIMIGIESNQGVNIHSIFKERHYMCDILLCAIVNSGHISHITIDYSAKSLIHADSCCGVHNSQVFLDGMEKFLRNHLLWRQEQGLMTRADITYNTSWNKIHSSIATNAQQNDNDSCGVYACWHATSRVLHLDPLYFTHCHVPLMRLHIYHCIMANMFFTLTISQHTEHSLIQMRNSERWYTTHRTEYQNLRKKRETRARKTTTLFPILAEGQTAPAKHAMVKPGTNDNNEPSINSAIKSVSHRRRQRRNSHSSQLHSVPDITIMDGRETKPGGETTIIDLTTSSLSDKPMQTVDIASLSQIQSTTNTPLAIELNTTSTVFITDQALSIMTPTCRNNSVKQRDNTGDSLKNIIIKPRPQHSHSQSPPVFYEQLNLKRPSQTTDLSDVEECSNYVSESIPLSTRLSRLPLEPTQDAFIPSKRSSKLRRNRRQKNNSPLHVSTTSPFTTSCSILPICTRVQADGCIPTNTTHRSHTRLATHSNIGETDVKSGSAHYPIMATHTAPLSVLGTVSTSPRKKRPFSALDLYHPAADIARPQSKKRALRKKITVGRARQKTTLDSFVQIVKPPVESSSSEEGGNAAPEIVSNLVMSMPKGSVYKGDSSEGDFMRVEAEIDNLPHHKRARTKRSESFLTTLSTLEYDKRIADS